MKFTVVDYGASNLHSVMKALKKLGAEARITSRKSEVLDSEAVIFPGVGAAGDAMSRLTRLDITDALRQVVRDGKPFLGLCLGLQLLFEESDEGGPGLKCLGILKGKVKLLPPNGLKIPHMGWNQVKQSKKHPIFSEIPDESNFYFVHSYYVEPEDNALVMGTTDYSCSFTSIIARGNLIATQFHPEKSGELGLRLLANFLKMK